MHNTLYFSVFTKQCYHPGTSITMKMKTVAQLHSEKGLSRDDGERRDTTGNSKTTD